MTLALAALAGAAGVGLAAIAAHRVESPALATAATILMIHCGAVVATLALAARAAKFCRWIAAAAALMLASVSLFSGDIAVNTLLGYHLFPMAAPIGGSLLILSWIALAIVALAAALNRR